MAFPLLVLGGLLGSVALNAQHKRYLLEQDQSRRLLLPSSLLTVAQLTEMPIGRWPSDSIPSPLSHSLVSGALVCCTVYQAFDHVGLVVDNDTIIELHGSGLIRAVSPERFLAKRSGKHMFIACDQQGQAFSFPQAVNAAINDVFSYCEYDALAQNCYRQTWHWIDGSDKSIESFLLFNQCIALKINQRVYWDLARS
ncbi:hypothetical protein ORJ66_13445 [Pseudoalteromonas tunicata]|uniref:hypothetical protein n=1 Tax=Pseudoalteromonas tunicata TaxID=314281 RepID=UPI00273D3C9F|nr:hypothetical protein [Pseudoalteromonas tunicata]MDP5214052.1 hypothetical protein [Pseudoalteromonas tunicata]